MSTEIIQWYSVDDDMPDDDETVLVYEPDSNEKVWLGYHDSDSECWRYIDGSKPTPPEMTERQHADEKANLSAG
jgi:hypothetical protein